MIMGMMKLSKRKFLIEIEEKSEYYKFIEEYGRKREISFTACIKQLTFDRIDELKNKSINIHEILLNLKNLPEKNILKEDFKYNAEETKKKDMLKNLKNLRR